MLHSGLYTTTTQVEVDKEVVLDCAESIMEALDNDGDGEITKVFRNITIANIF